MLVIDPEECIDCTLCEPECPIDAIYADDELPPDQHAMLDMNASYSAKWPVITAMRDAPPDAAAWEEVDNKYPEHFSSKPGGGDDE